MSPNTPPAPVQTLDELFAIAHRLESDAVAHYATMAAEMRDQKADDLAALFERLAAVEGTHVDQIVAWSEQSRGHLPEQESLPWPVPDLFDAPAAEAGRSRLLTPYRALAAAVRQEERSFAFWSYVAAEAGREDVRSAAEQMAAEELEHVALLRRERRRAFHGERDGSRPPLDLFGLAEREDAVADDLAARFAAADPRGRLAEQARTLARRLRALHLREPALTIPVQQTAGRDLIARTELLIGSCLAAAETAGSGETMRELQEIAAVAIIRLATLQGSTPPNVG